MYYFHIEIHFGDTQRTRSTRSDLITSTLDFLDTSFGPHAFTSSSPCSFHLAHLQVEHQIHIQILSDSDSLHLIRLLLGLVRYLASHWKNYLYLVRTRTRTPTTSRHVASCAPASPRSASSADVLRRVPIIRWRRHRHEHDVDEPSTLSLTTIIFAKESPSCSAAPWGHSSFKLLDDLMPQHLSWCRGTHRSNSFLFCRSVVVLWMPMLALISDDDQMWWWSWSCCCWWWIEFQLQPSGWR